jgi:hypothetical protein
MGSPNASTNTTLVSVFSDHPRMRAFTTSPTHRLTDFADFAEQSGPAAAVAGRRRTVDRPFWHMGEAHFAGSPDLVHLDAPARTVNDVDTYSRGPGVNPHTSRDAPRHAPQESPRIGSTNEHRHLAGRARLDEPSRGIHAPGAGRRSAHVRHHRGARQQRRRRRRSEPGRPGSHSLHHRDETDHGRQEIADTVNTVTSILTAFLGAIAGLSLVGASLVAVWNIRSPRPA